MPAALKNGAHSDFISHGAALGGMSPKGNGALLVCCPVVTDFRCHISD